MGIAKSLSIAGLVLLLASSCMQAFAQTAVTARPTMQPQLIHGINIDPNMLPVTTAPTPTGGVVPPRHCGPHRVMSVSWNKDSTLMAVGMGSGGSGCPFSGPVQIFDMSDPARPRLLHTLHDFKDRVRAVAFNHDGTRLAVGGDDKKVRIYDPVSPSAPLATLSDATGPIRSVKYNHGGTQLAVGGNDQKVRIYDPRDLSIRPTILTDSRGWVMDIDYNHDDTELATVSRDYRLRVYDPRDLSIAPQAKIPWLGQMRSVKFNHDGTLLAIGGSDLGRPEKRVGVYDTKNLASTKYTLLGATDKVMSIDFNYDSTRIAAGSADHKVRIYDMLNLPGVLYTLSDATDVVRSVEYNHDGTLLAVGAEDGKVRIYQVATGAPATTSSSARPSTSQLTTASPSARPSTSIPTTASTTISRSPLGNSTLTRPSSSYTTQPTTSGTTNMRPLLIHVINIDPNVLPVTTAPTPTGGVVPPRYCGPHRVMGVSWNMNSMLMAVGMGSGGSGCPISGPVQIFDMSDPARPRMLHTLHDFKDWVRSVAFNHDGTRLAVGGDDKKVRIYDPVSPSTPLATLSDATGAVRSVKYNHDSTQLAVGGQDQKVRIYDSNDLSISPHTLSDASDWVMSVDYNYDGTQLAVGGRDKKVRVYDPRDLSIFPRILQDSNGQVRSVKYNHDGTQLATGGSDNKARNRVRIYNPNDLTFAPQVLSDARDWIMSIDFNHDGTQLAVGSGDRRVRIYDMSNTSDLLHTKLPPPIASKAINPTRPLYIISDAKNDVRSVEYNHDGTLLAVGGEDEKVRIYRFDIRASATTSSSTRLSTSKLTTASFFASHSTSKLATASTTISGVPSENSTLITHSSSYTALPHNTKAPSLPGSCPQPEGIPLFQAYDAKNEQIYVVIQPESHTKKVNLARYKGSELDEQFGLCGIVTYTTSASSFRRLASYQSLAGQVIHETTGSHLDLIATPTSGKTVLLEFPLIVGQGYRARFSVHDKVFPEGVQINDTAHHQGVMYLTGKINNKLLMSSYHQQRLTFPKKCFKSDGERGLFLRVSPDGKHLYVTGISGGKNAPYSVFIRQFEKKQLNPAFSFGYNGKEIVIDTNIESDNSLQDILIQKNHVYVAVFNPASEKLSICRFATDNGQMDSAFIIDDTIRCSSGTSGRFLTVRLVTAKNCLQAIIYNSNGQLSVITYENQVNVHHFDTAFKIPATRSMRPVFVGNNAYLAAAYADIEKGTRHVRMQVISLHLENLSPSPPGEFPEWGIGLITVVVVVLVVAVSVLVHKKYRRKPPVPVSDATNALQE
ncbi:MULTISPECIES: WD40 domain-containing protein [unclassified Endozoicomonas]|uniref:WD40 domain-containing protein n=3 Tax=Endozoicomonas TaxID=305899 RepID=UPI003BB5F098